MRKQTPPVPDQENVNTMNVRTPRNTSPRKIIASIPPPLERTAEYPIKHALSPLKASTHSSPRGKVQGIASRFGAIKRPVSGGGGPRKSLATHGDVSSETGAAAKLLLSQLDVEDAGVIQSIEDSFDRMDGTNVGWLPRDVCLVMLSLVLEERGVRHFSIPKVICSRVCSSNQSFLYLCRC
jgi:hypothetical protein